MAHLREAGDEIVRVGYPRSIFYLWRGCANRPQAEGSHWVASLKTAVSRGRIILLYASCEWQITKQSDTERNELGLSKVQCIDGYYPAVT